jgi:zinc protease
VSGRTLLILLAASAATLAVFVMAAPRSASAAGAAGGKLPNAPVLLPVAGDPTVSCKLMFAVGTQNDPPGKEGLANLTAQIMSDGATRKHSYSEVLELLYPMASGYGVRVDKEVTTFSGRIHKDNLAAYTTLFTDAILQPAFDEADFKRIKQRTRDFIEKQLRYSSDEELGKQTLYGAVFAGTPYAHINAGTVSGLDAITLDDVKAFYAKNYTREALTLAVGGGYDKAYVDQLSGTLAALPSGKVAAVPAPAVAPIVGRKVIVVKKPGASTAISFGFPISARRGDREFYALWLANSWLGEHRNSSSHLYQVIRDARGMNYGDYSYIEIFPEGGNRQMPPTNVPRRKQLFEVWIRPVPNDQAHFALRAAMREVESLAKNGLTKEQFDLTREFVTKYSLHFAETTTDRLGYAVDDRVYGVSAPGNLAKFKQVVPTLTLEEVNAAIKKYIRPENMVIAVVTEKADEFAAALAAGTPSPMTYQTPKPSEVMTEDKQIEAYPLAIRKEAITIVPVDQMFAQ